METKEENRGKEEELPKKKELLSEEELLEVAAGAGRRLWKCYNDCMKEGGISEECDRKCYGKNPRYNDI